jgi:hypothetical protein
MEKLFMANHSTKSPGHGPHYPDRFLTPSAPLNRPERGKPTATRDDVHFTVMVDDTPFEFTITRQALEDVDGTRDKDTDLLTMFMRNRDRVERIALDRIDAGVRWPHLVIRMQNVPDYHDH